MPRNRTVTEQRLIDAVGQLLSEDGIEGIRINRIAKRAGVNKILIYRYFGGLDGLREAYINRSQPVISLPPVDVEVLRNGPLDVFFETCCEYAIAGFRLLRQNPQAMALLKANLLNQDSLPNSMAIENAYEYQHMADELAEILGTNQGHSFTALINSGMTLLTFLSQQKRTAFGLDLSADATWDDIENMLRNLFRGAYLYTKERQQSEAQTPNSSSSGLPEST